jgi:hypothetical protein
MGLRFIGARDTNGQPVEYIGWAPARDLTDAECDEIGADRVAALIASNLYKPDAPAKASAKGSAQGEEG